MLFWVLHSHSVPVSPTPCKSPSSSSPLWNSLSWWRRWRLHSAAETIRVRVRRIIEQSKFLSKTLSRQDVTGIRYPVVDINVMPRHKVVLGQVLGRGSFSQVSGIYNSLHDWSGHCATCETETPLQSTTIVSRQQPYRYVLKEMNPVLLDPKQSTLQEYQQAATNLILEAAYLSRLHHVNIVRVRGVSHAVQRCMFDCQPSTRLKHNQNKSDDEDSKTDYFCVMQYIPETLDQRMQVWSQWEEEERASLLPVQADIAYQLARVLAFLQQRRIIYRDLKPSNIGLVGQSSNHLLTVKLFDFGTCRELPPAHPSEGWDPCAPELRHFHYYHDSPNEEIFHMSQVGSTPRYQAPEVMTTHLYNGKCDVYSWAIIVAELFTLKQPFQGYSLADHLKKVVLLQERPALAARKLPHSLEELIRHAWATNLLQRPTASQLLSHMELIRKHDIQPLQ